MDWVSKRSDARTSSGPRRWRGFMASAALSAMVVSVAAADDDGSVRPYLTEDEPAALKVARGSLTQDERRQIESHVVHTMAFLRTIPWGRSLARLPGIAGAHHELLDGSGYPAKLRSEAIPIEARMLTIADIFDALTASDRPGVRRRP